MKWLKVQINAAIKSAEILGYDYPTTFAHTTDELTIKINERIETGYPVCIKILFD